MVRLASALLVAAAISAAALGAGDSGYAKTHVATKRVVVEATWRIGIPVGRFTRQEWYERATGNTRRQEGGGPACARTTVVSRGRMASWGCFPRRVLRLRGSTDPRLVWQTSDLLRPRRLLQLRRATVVGPVKVGERDAVRVELPVNRKYGEGPFDAAHFADLEPVTRLPLRFVFEREGQTYTYTLQLRYISRSVLSANFFNTTPVGS
jgi:hypothetical protein